MAPAPLADREVEAAGRTASGVGNSRFYKLVPFSSAVGAEFDGGDGKTAF